MPMAGSTLTIETRVRRLWVFRLAVLYVHLLMWAHLIGRDDCLLLVNRLLGLLVVEYRFPHGRWRRVDVKPRIEVSYG
jgi:hypothetical protein